MQYQNTFWYRHAITINLVSQESEVRGLLGWRCAKVFWFLDELIANIPVSALPRFTTNILATSQDFFQQSICEHLSVLKFEAGVSSSTLWPVWFSFQYFQQRSSKTNLNWVSQVNLRRTVTISFSAYIWWSAGQIFSKSSKLRKGHQGCFYKIKCSAQQVKYYSFTSYLIFVIFFTRAKFLENKIYTEKMRKLRQNTQKIANFCVITAKYTVNCQFFALNL